MYKSLATIHLRLRQADKVGGFCFKVAELAEWLGDLWSVDLWSVDDSRLDQTQIMFGSHKSYMT
jgi:hypothetical protein